MAFFNKILEDEHRREEMVTKLIRMYDKNMDFKIDPSEMKKFFEDGVKEGIWSKDIDSATLEAIFKK